MNWPFFKGREFFAVDVGTSYIKAAAVKGIKGVPVVTQLYKIKTPEGVYGENFKPEVLAGALEELKKECKIGRQRVISCLGRNKVFTRHLKFPVMPAGELEKAVRWEVEKLLPVPAENVFIDYTRLGQSKEKEVHLLAGAVDNGVIKDFCRAFELADLELSAIDLKVLALWRVYRDITWRESAVIVELGSYTANVVFIKDRELVYNRTFVTGGKYSDSEEENSGFLKELSRTFDFYAGREDDVISRLVLSGGYGNDDGVIKLLTRKMDILVEPGIFSDNKSVASDVNPVYAVAVGLAMREMKYV